MVPPGRNQLKLPMQLAERTSESLCSLLVSISASVWLRAAASSLRQQCVQDPLQLQQDLVMWTGDRKVHLRLRGGQPASPIYSNGL
jgi:hypothetical protein